MLAAAVPSRQFTPPDRLNSTVDGLCGLAIKSQVLYGGDYGVEV